MFIRNLILGRFKNAATRAKKSLAKICYSNKNMLKHLLINLTFFFHHLYVLILLIKKEVQINAHYLHFL